MTEDQPLAEPTLTDELLRIAREAAQQGEVDSRVLAARHIRRVPAGQLRELAMRELASWIDHIRRSEALDAERSASRARTSTSTALAQRDERQDRLAQYEEWLSDPSILDWGRRVSDTGAPTVVVKAADRRRFIKWLGDRYRGWYERGCTSVDQAVVSGLYNSRSGHTYFRSDFYAEGASAWFAEERMSRVLALVATVADEVRLETTERLLNTIFALGDGRKTTWGKATIEEHEQRIALLARNAAGVVETAARHEAAIRMIREAGVVCLADLPVGGVA